MIPRLDSLQDGWTVALGMDCQSAGPCVERQGTYYNSSSPWFMQRCWIARQQGSTKRETTYLVIWERGPKQTDTLFLTANLHEAFFNEVIHRPRNKQKREETWSPQSVKRLPFRVLLALELASHCLCTVLCPWNGPTDSNGTCFSSISVHSCNLRHA